MTNRSRRTERERRKNKGAHSLSLDTQQTQTHTHTGYTWLVLSLAQSALKHKQLLNSLNLMRFVTQRDLTTSTLFTSTTSITKNSTPLSTLSLSRDETYLHHTAIMSFLNGPVSRSHSPPHLLTTLIAVFSITPFPPLSLFLFGWLTIHRPSLFVYFLSVGFIPKGGFTPG